MELKWLKDFLTLCSTGNFRVAAQQRCVSQPAFSRRIEALEAWIGAPLIDRGSQPSQLTEAGELFWPVAKKIVDLAKAGKQDIQTHIQEDKERISFVTFSSLAQIFIPGWLKTLRPFIDANQFVIKIDCDTIEECFSVLEENTLDFFICYEDHDHRFLENKQVFTSLKLGTETLIPVVSPKSDGTPRWWLPDKPTGQIPCLHTVSKNSPSPVWHHMNSKYRNHRFKSIYDSTIAPPLKAMAIEGFGLAWIPSTHITDELASGQLVRAAEQADDIVVDIKIYRSLKNTEPRVEKLWQVLLKHDTQ